MTADRGFSLIELLVVVAIVSTLAVGASLAIPLGGANTRMAVSDLMMQAGAMRREAMIAGAARSLTVASGGWSDEVETADGWRPVRQGPLRGVLPIPADVKLEFGADGDVGGADFTLAASSATYLCSVVDDALMCSPR